MHKIIIDKLGPIQHCELTINQYTVLTGYQASGKSTIARAIYFFRTLKEDLERLIVRRDYVALTELYSVKTNKTSLVEDFENAVHSKFLSTFGSLYNMDSGMALTYQYSQHTNISIHLTIDSVHRMQIYFSSSILEFLRADHSTKDHKLLKQELSELFADPFETVYIPAGRSVLTVLGSQFSYFYATMDDEQKRLLDSCTKDYLERVLRLRPQFENGLEGISEGIRVSTFDRPLRREALKLIEQILKGKYTVADGEERIWVDSDHYVKINFASSGQQESVWILNLLYYYFALEQPIYFIIEEPESNLFPESQKLIVELIALVVNTGNAVLLTTHSPYVLGAINNLLYAGHVRKVAADETRQIVASYKWIDNKSCEARFVENGGAEDCMDRELMQIDNSLLDQISHSINQEYDKLFEVEQRAKGE